MAGDQWATGAVRTMNEYLAATIMNLVAIIDPEMVVLGGDLSELPHVEELFVLPIKQLIEQHTGSQPPMRLSQLQGDAALYGALQAAIDVALDVAEQAGFRAQSLSTHPLGSVRTQDKVG